MSCTAHATCPGACVNRPSSCLARNAGTDRRPDSSNRKEQCADMSRREFAWTPSPYCNRPSSSLRSLRSLRLIPSSPAENARASLKIAAAARALLLPVARARPFLHPLRRQASLVPRAATPAPSSACLLTADLGPGQPGTQTCCPCRTGSRRRGALTGKASRSSPNRHHEPRGTSPRGRPVGQSHCL